MDKISVTALLLLLLVSPLSFAKSCDSLTSVSWLVGNWSSTVAQVSIKESWVRLSENTFDGMSVTSSSADGQTLATDHMRIVDMGDNVFLVAKVAGNDLPISFKLTSCDGKKLMFENHWHSFPKLISYRYINNDNVAVVVSDTGSKVFDFVYKRDSM